MERRCVLRDGRFATSSGWRIFLMPLKASVILGSALFETPPAAAPEDKLARLDVSKDRKSSMQPDNSEKSGQG
jgi:hypothetical protein